jgi:hypothetical protein
MMPACRALSHLLNRRLLSPGPKRFAPSTPVADSTDTEAMTPWLEVTVEMACAERNSCAGHVI